MELLYQSGDGCLFAGFAFQQFRTDDHPRGAAIGIEHHQAGAAVLAGAGGAKYLAVNVYKGPLLNAGLRVSALQPGYQEAAERLLVYVLKHPAEQVVRGKPFAVQQSVGNQKIGLAVAECSHRLKILATGGNGQHHDGEQIMNVVADALRLAEVCDLSP